MIPAVNLARGGKTIPAAAKTVVNWQDLVNTQMNARARIALDDGSVLNVGSDSSIQVSKHDAGAQQTELCRWLEPLQPGRIWACGERWQSSPGR